MTTTKRHDWLMLEARWIAGEWPTLRAMSQDTGITERMIQKRSFTHKWKEKRESVEAEATERARKRAIKGLADRITEANERALKSADVLLKLGLSRFVDKRGRLRKITIVSDATAAQMIKSSIQIEQAILRQEPMRGPLGDEPPGEGPIIPPSDSGIEELSDADLERIANAASRAIQQLDKNEKPDRKRTGGHRGTKKKAAGKN